MPLKALVFDFDGVIANSEPLHFRGYRDVLAEEGLLLTERDYYAEYLGFDDVGAFEAIGRRHGSTWTAQHIAALPIAIASGARGDEIRRVLVREELLECFAAIVAAEDTAVSKPSPDPYLRAVSLLASGFDHLTAAQCVAIEDSHWGLESARAAGLHTVAVTNTYPAEQLTADLTISSLQALDLDVLVSLCSE
jgi:beta-phosphoglucomutase